MKKHKQMTVATLIAPFALPRYIRTIDTPEDEIRNVTLKCSCNQTQKVLLTSDAILDRAFDVCCLHINAICFPSAQDPWKITITQRGRDILDWRHAARALLK